MAKKKKTVTATYENSKGVFTLVDGKLYDSQDNQVSAKDIGTNRDPLTRVAE